MKKGFTENELAVFSEAYSKMSESMIPEEKLLVVAFETIDILKKERDAYKKAKAENDERFMLERDAAHEKSENLYLQIKLKEAEWERRMVCVDTGDSANENGECPTHHGDACLIAAYLKEERQRSERVELERESLASQLAVAIGIPHNLTTLAQAAVEAQQRDRERRDSLTPEQRDADDAEWASSAAAWIAGAPSEASNKMVDIWSDDGRVCEHVPADLNYVWTESEMQILLAEAYASGNAQMEMFGYDQSGNVELEAVKRIITKAKKNKKS